MSEAFAGFPRKIDVIVWEIGADRGPADISFVSSRAEQILGYPAEAWRTEPGFLLNHTHPEDRKKMAELVRHPFGNGESRELTHRFLAANGRALWFRTEVALTTPGSAVPRLRGLMVDITGQRHAEARFHGFLESAPDAIVVVDHDGRMVLANRLAEQMFGRTRAELLGSPVELLVPERYRKAHIGHRTRYSAAPQTRPMGAGRALTGLKKDGSEFPIEISLSPLQFEEGALVISIIRDITDRIRAEAKFRGLLESAPDGIVVVDTRGRIVMVNTQTEKMFGYGRDELLGQLVEVLVPDRLREGHVHTRDVYIGAPQTRPMGAGRHLTGRTKDGTEFPVEISLSPLETEQGTLITSIIRDITDRRKAEQQIQNSLREKEVLLKEIHHRVKNNLQVTSSLLNLQSDYILDPQARDMFAESQNRIRSMALVHEKLYQSSDLSRIDFPEYIQTLAQLLFRSFGADQRRIALEVRGVGVFLGVDTAVPCGLILNEMLSNSLKHAFPGGRTGTIRTQVTCEGSRIALRVADNGIGLPKEFNWETAETLGLQLVRMLTRQLNGELEVRRGDWTEFLLHFPSAKT